jgi:hypothetical protein
MFIWQKLCDGIDKSGAIETVAESDEKRSFPRNEK